MFNEINSRSLDVIEIYLFLTVCKPGGRKFWACVWFHGVKRDTGSYFSAKWYVASIIKDTCKFDSAARILAITSALQQ